MRDLAGRDSRRCHYRDLRSTFKGNDNYKELVK